MKKNVFIILIVLVGVLLVYKNFEVKKNLSLEISKISDYKNISYTIDGEVVTFVNGISEMSSGSGATGKTVTKYFGNEVMKDFNNDGRKDIAFLIIRDVGGSGVFTYVVAALNTENGYIGSRGVLLGDRIAPQTTESGPGDSIIVNYMDRTSDEPMSAQPSVGKSLYLKLNAVTMELEKIDNSTTKNL